MLTIGCAGAVRAQLDVEAPAAFTPSNEVETYELQSPALSVETDVSAGAAYTVSFPRSVGVLKLDRKSLKASSFSAQVDITSAQASWQLVADIARDDFLHATQFPQGTFNSVSLAKAECAAPPCDESAFTLFGDLSLHGKTRRISMPLSLEVDGCEARAALEFEIDRQEFGIRNDGGYEGLVSNTVVVRISARAALSGRPPSCDAAPPP
jgi:polyisoprenoid-binding protein YceI